MQPQLPVPLDRRGSSRRSSHGLRIADLAEEIAAAIRADDRAAIDRAQRALREAHRRTP